MNRIRRFFSDWSMGEKCWLAFVCIFQAVVWGINRDTPFMLALALTGSLNLVLGAKGKVAGLYFAIINSALYAYNCIGIPLYGEVMYNILYSIPVSAIAIVLWRRNSADGGEVKFRTMNARLAVIMLTITTAAVFLYMEMLKWMGGSFVFMDSLTTVVSVVASMLYMLRYSEQWLMWVAVNALSIVMWIIVFASGDKSALMIIVMKSINLVNSLYGYMNWKKIARKAEAV